MVEMLQNIIHHASYMNEGETEKPGIFYLKESNNQYILNAGNFINNKNVDELTLKIEQVNTMTKDDLDHFYNTKLLDFNENISYKAGLGIIDMRIKSDSDLKFYFKKINDQFSFFNLEIDVETKFS